MKDKRFIDGANLESERLPVSKVVPMDRRHRFVGKDAPFAPKSFLAIGNIQ
jgi:hypothetical protein